MDEHGGARSGSVPCSTIAAQWTRIGCLGFGGPPTHISLLRQLCVSDRQWLSDAEFEDGTAATNLLPGPTSNQLAIFCAWRLRGTAGGLLGGVCFILPGLLLILVLAALFLGSPPIALRAVAAGAGAAVAAVAVHAAAGLVPGSWGRTAAPPGTAQVIGPSGRPSRRRWVGYLGVGLLAGAAASPLLVLVLLGCGLLETAVRRPTRPSRPRPPVLSILPVLVAPLIGAPGTAGLAWVALKVGLLSYGGGFVIVPLMQADAVVRYEWITDGEFLNAVALGQLTPGPVLHTVAVVGYAALTQGSTVDLRVVDQRGTCA